MKPGKRNLITDVEGLLVGNAEDAGVRTGATVLLGAQPFVAAVHVMGGAPGTRETDLLAPDKLVQEVDALVLAGGSAFGLDAASGVADALRAAGRGFEVGGMRVPIVPGAILFDLLNGGDKDWGENPYKRNGGRRPPVLGGTLGDGGRVRRARSARAICTRAGAKPLEADGRGHHHSHCRHRCRPHAGAGTAPGNGSA
jgi:D-aminopeptidase